MTQAPESTSAHDDEPAPALPFGAVWPSRVQLLVLAPVLALFLIDGIDMQMLAVAVPSIATAWRIPATQFAVALALGHVGGAFGGTLGGALGDRIGRKRAIVGCAVLFGLLSVSLGFASRVEHLMVLRLFAGLGLGGCIPAAIALLTEQFPPRQRAMVIALAFLCTPLGIGSAGLMAAALIPSDGWQGLFFAAGGLSLVLVVGMQSLLPAAPPIVPAASGHRVPRRRPALPPGFALAAVGLCCGFFFVYVAVSIVLSWLPTELAGQGFSLGASGRALSAWSFGGMLGIPLAGWAGGRWGARRLAAITSLAGAAAALVIALTSLVGTTMASDSLAFDGLLALTGNMVNATIILYFTVAAETFPTAIRATGVGLAATAGRIGAILGALLGGHAAQLAGLPGFFGAVAGLLLVALLAPRLAWRGA